MHRLTEGLYHRNTSYILGCLTAHRIQCILVFLHLFLHTFSHHGHHAAKPDHRRDHTEQSDLPVKCKNQYQQADRCYCCHGLVRHGMGNIGLSRCSRIVYDTADLAGPVFIKYPQR